MTMPSLLRLSALQRLWLAAVCVLAAARWDGQTALAPGEWWPIADLESAGLPTVFAKAARLFREDGACGG